jgi:hypothetical protein
MKKFTAQASEKGKDKYGYVPSPSPINNGYETKGLVPSPAPTTQANPAPSTTTKK